MIIPTAAFDPMFADDGIPFGLKMRQYIQREFADEPELVRRLAGTETGLAIVAAIFIRHADKTASHRDVA